ncbi:hypothetical protein D3C81_1047980 [compost metagenome]
MACGGVVGEHHGQCQQQVGHCCFLLLTITAFTGVQGLLQVIQYLPDPGGSADGATEKWQCRIEDHPGGVLERRPAILCVGHRFPFRQFDQCIDVGLVQSGHGIAGDDARAE